MEPNESRMYRREESVIIPPIAHYPNWAFRCPACNRTYELSQEMTDIKEAHESGTLHYFRPCGCIKAQELKSVGTYLNSDGMTYAMTVNDSMGTINGVNVDLHDEFHISALDPNGEASEWWSKLSDEDRVVVARHYYPFHPVDAPFGWFSEALLIARKK